MTVRQARPEDHDAVVDFTSETWADRGGSDYIPHIYHEWIAGDGDDQRTFVLDAEGDEKNPSEELAGICQGVLLSEYEAWAQGMRVNPDYRGEGASMHLSKALFAWARERGATVARNMVFSWNVAGLGQSRATGFGPCTEFRWGMPTPDADAEPDLSITAEADAAWSFWTGSDARADLKGLALDAEESWAVSELTREQLRTAADDGRLFVASENGTRGFTFRNRTYDRANDEGKEERWAEYAVGAWADHEAADSLYRAIARDAAGVDADKVRVLIPEGVRWVSDTAYARTGVSDEPDFVMEADLTDPSVSGN
ncbi:GCN5 family acetyltransferase [Haloprofundus marisrubri]|uniref:GCN5 family acetyltransferase n=1 Tax=Haloprofundus marisrubri TaxID=1514971 RepID=A0A0W1R8K8_9EURY|nr:GNAT family N-acetyltransferase [Haloprofundus marisrubri]KTG09580.1 GCN5 family acetyltransferase [Haloprofundus marisrubri]